MASAIALSQPAETAGTPALALLFYATSAACFGLSAGMIDRFINVQAPVLADTVIEAPEDFHGLRPAQSVLETPPPFVLPFGAALQRQRAVNCLTEAVYYEAGVEPLEGKQAVAQVVLNRVRDRNFPNTVCGVVYQGYKRKTGCQFTFACDGSRSRRPPGQREWDTAQAVAERALDGFVMAEVGTATHYHTLTSDPWWRPTVVKVSEVGDHVFYRWPGRAGTVAALDEGRYGRVEPALAQGPRG